MDQVTRRDVISTHLGRYPGLNGMSLRSRREPQNSRFAESAVSSMFFLWQLTMPPPVVSGPDPCEPTSGPDRLLSDRGSPDVGCAGERGFAMPELASFYGARTTVGDVVRRMRCSGACGGRVGTAWLVTGRVLNMRVRPRRVPLQGPEARE